MARSFAGSAAPLRRPWARARTDSRSCRAGQPPRQARAPVLRRDSRTCKALSPGCASEQCPENSLLEFSLELAHLAFGEESPLAGPELFVFESSDTDAAEFFDGMPDGLKHSPDLLVPPLVQCDFVPGILATPEKLDLAWSEPLVVDVGAAPKPHQVAFSRLAAELHVVNLRDAPGLRHEFRKLSVVGQDEQPFGTKVQAADGINPLFDGILHIFQNCRTVLRIAGRGHDVPGFVQQNVDMTLCGAEFLTINLDDVLG